MVKIKQILTKLGFEGWAFLLCGAGSVVIAVLDFTQVIHLTNENALRIIMVAIGLVMGTIAAQTGRRTAELQDLRDSLGATSIELVNISDSRLYAIRARKFILDTTLHLARAINMTHPADFPNHHYYARVMNKEITLQKIEAIPTKERLESHLSLIFRPKSEFNHNILCGSDNRYTRRIGKYLSILFQDSILWYRPQDVVWSNSGIHKKFERKMS